jgi:XrtJ-associated TM-motif-TM protein
MRKILLLVSVCAAMFATTPALYAQGGCVDSPENSTANLAMISCACGFFVLARVRLKARRKP